MRRALEQAIDQASGRAFDPALEASSSSTRSTTASAPFGGGAVPFEIGSFDIPVSQSVACDPNFVRDPCTSIWLKLTDVQCITYAKACLEDASGAGARRLRIQLTLVPDLLVRVRGSRKPVAMSQASAVNLAMGSRMAASEISRTRVESSATAAMTSPAMAR
jgi:hypothetical protein